MEPIRRLREQRNARAQKKREICFTAYGTPGNLKASCDALVGTCPSITHFHAQLERCPETERYHVQAFLRLSSQRTFAAWKTLLSAVFRHAPHIEFAKGGITKNIDYCGKLESRATERFFEFRIGEPATPGKRNDIHKAVAKVLADELTTGVYDGLVDEDTRTFALRYPAAYLTLTNKHALRQQRDTAPTVVILHGGTGTGKSRYVHDKWPDHWESPLKTSSSDWWDTYDGQDVAFLDEYAEGNQYHISTLKRLLDRYPVLAPVKGAFTVWFPRIIVMATNAHDPLHTWYPTADAADIAALTRRVTLVVNTDEDDWQDIVDALFV